MVAAAGRHVRGTKLLANERQILSQIWGLSVSRDLLEEPLRTRQVPRVQFREEGVESTHTKMTTNSEIIVSLCLFATIVFLLFIMFASGVR